MPATWYIDTRDFFKLVFDMNDCSKAPVGWETCKPLPDVKFVSDYALSWENPNNPGHYSITEVFAESFAMYVLHGKLYRKLTTIDPSYQLQYDWLKENVFGGVEYCTGDENLVIWDHPRWNYYNNALPQGVSSILEDAFIPSRVNDDNPIFSLSDRVVKCQEPVNKLPEKTKIL